MAFPTSPTNGQTTTVNNILYRYNSSVNRWERVLNNVSLLTNNTASIRFGSDNSIVIESDKQITNPIGGAIAFDRTSNGYLSMSSPINFGTSPWTVEAWVYPQDTGQNFILGVGTTPGVNLYFNNTIFVVQSGYGAAEYFTISYTPNTWTHFAVSFDGTYVNLWVNGVGSGKQNYGSGSADWGNNILSIGAMPWASGYGNLMRMTQLRIVVGSLVYDPNSSHITVPSSQLTNIANTQFLMLANSSGSAYTDITGNQTITNNAASWVSASPFSSITNNLNDWVFGSTGTLKFPDNTIQLTAYTGTVAYNNIIGLPASVSSISTGSGITVSTSTGAVTISFNTSTLVQSAVNAQFATTTTNFNTGTLVKNAVNAQFATTTTNFNTGTLVQSAVNAQFATTTTNFNTGTLINTAVNSQFLTNGTFTVSVSTTGNLVLTANQSISNTGYTGGNISWSAANQTDFQGSIKVGGNIIKSGGGASSITLNNNGFTAPSIGVTLTTPTTSTTVGALTVAGGVGISGGIYVGGTITATQITINGFAVSTSSGGGFATTSSLVSGVSTVSLTTTGALTTVTGITVSSATGALFVGDFDNLTVNNRTNFVTKTVNSSTGIYAIPNGTSGAASWQAANSSNLTNASKILIATNGSTDVQLVSGINGSGTYLPLSFYTNGASQMQLSTAGVLTMQNAAGGITVTGSGGFIAGASGQRGSLYGSSSYAPASNTDFALVVGGGSGGNSAQFSSSIQIQGGANNYGSANGYGGQVQIYGGNALGTTSFGGNVVIQAGSGTSLNGAVSIGVSNTSLITLGNSSTFTTGWAQPGFISSTAASLGYLGMPQNSTGSAYTLLISDQGKHIYVTATSTVTIPSYTTVNYPIGTTIAFIAAAGATVTIAITSDTMYLGGSGTTGSRTLAPYGMATAVKVAQSTWFINGTGLT